MPLPDAIAVQEWSLTDFGGLGFDDDGVQRLVDRAIALVGYYTGRAWADDGTFTPANLSPLADQAVQVVTEFLAFRAEAAPETLSDFDMIESFTAGSYSEQHRSPADMAKAGFASLQALLWPLMTEEAQDQWLFLMGAGNRPDFSVTGVDYTWGRQGMLPNDTERLWPRYGDGEYQ